MPRHVLRRNLGRIVIVNLVDGDEKAFQGTLTAADHEYLSLDDALLIAPRGDMVNGGVVIPLTNVAWVQVLP